MMLDLVLGAEEITISTVKLLLSEKAENIVFRPSKEKYLSI